jgi:argininosuccinate lyase
MKRGDVPTDMTDFGETPGRPDGTGESSDAGAAAASTPARDAADSGAAAPRAKPWGGRFQGAQAPLFERLNASLPYDHVLAPYDLAGSRAHVRMLGGIGVLTPADVDVLLTGLDRVGEEVASDKFVWDLTDEDVHMALERRLTEIVGPVGGKVHTGRSRNDQVALDVQLYLRDAIKGHLDRVLGLMDVLLERATAGTDVVLPGYTHLQRAQPVLLAHHLLAYVALFERDAGRFLRWFASSRMPLGAGALAGVNYPLDRARVARELGFAEVAWNAMDAVAARDTAFEYVAVATSSALGLSRLAEELVLWTTAEFGFASLPDSWTSGSSIMPQKRNPDAAELIRGKAAGFLGRLTALGALVKGLPLAYNKDLQEDKLSLFATRDELDLCLEAMTAMMAEVRFHPERTRAAAEGGYAQATDVADYLVARGLPFREAHHAAGRLVARAVALGKALDQLTHEELQAVNPLLGDGYREAVSLDRVLAAKVSPGGTSPARVREQLTHAAEVLERLRAATESLPAVAK